MEVASIILAGGQGTRLFPLTQLRCKPSVSFGGTYRLIDIPMSNSLNANIKRIFVIAQFFATELNHHLMATYPQEHFQNDQIQLLSPEETTHGKVWFKGTADAVRQNLDHILKSPAEYFLILSGDQLYNMDLQKLVDFAIRENTDLVIATLPVMQAEASRMGLMRVNEKMQVMDFHEKPKDPSILKDLELKGYDSPHYLGSMGIYVFKRAALIALLKEIGDDFGNHLIPIQIKKGKTFAFVYKGYWEDIGTVASYYNANLALCLQRPSFDIYNENRPIFARVRYLPSPLIQDTQVRESLISQGAIVEAKEISRSIVGVRAQIGKGCVIRDSIIMSSTIGENCLIEKTIIDEQASIGNNVQLINKNHLNKYDGDGIYIRDGIIIVTTGTHIPDGFIL